METIRSIKGNVHLFLIDLCINIIKRKKKSIPLFYVSPIPHLVLRCFFPGLLKICVLHDVCVSSKYFIYDTVRQKKRKIKIVMWILHCFRELRCTFYILFTIVYSVHIWWLLCYILWDYAANVCMNWICYCYGLFCNDRE